MSGSIYMAASGALANQLRMELISNNLANANTVGFKRDTAVFRVPEDDTAGEVDPAKVAEIDKVDIFHALKVSSTRTDFTKGPLKQTGNPLDLAITGEGFFTIQTPQGEQYTRNGMLTLDNNGQLVTSNGYPVLGDGGPITIQGSDVAVDAKGNVSVDGSALDKIRVVTFGDLRGLIKVGDTRFAPADENAVGQPAEDIVVHQGALEMSNVSAVRSLVEMIEVARLYESYQKVIRSSDEVAAQANSVGSAT